MNSLQIAFIENGGQFVPSHLSEIKIGDTYYLVVDGKPSVTRFIATTNPTCDSNNVWQIEGTPIVISGS